MTVNAAAPSENSCRSWVGRAAKQLGIYTGGKGILAKGSHICCYLVWFRELISLSRALLSLLNCTLCL